MFISRQYQTRISDDFEWLCVEAMPRGYVGYGYEVVADFVLMMMGL